MTCSYRLIYLIQVDTIFLVQTLSHILEQIVPKLLSRIYLKRSGLDNVYLEIVIVAAVQHFRVFVVLLVLDAEKTLHCFFSEVPFRVLQKMDFRKELIFLFPLPRVSLSITLSYPFYLI